MRDPEPYFHDFPTVEEHRRAWYLWRALWRDSEMTVAERAAQLEALCERLDQLPTRHSPAQT